MEIKVFALISFSENFGVITACGCACHSLLNNTYIYVQVYRVKVELQCLTESKYKCV